MFSVMQIVQSVLSVPKFDESLVLRFVCLSYSKGMSLHCLCVLYFSSTGSSSSKPASEKGEYTSSRPSDYNFCNLTGLCLLQLFL